MAFVQKTSQFFFDGVTGTTRSITGASSGSALFALVSMCSQPNPNPTAAVPDPTAGGGWTRAVGPTGATTVDSYKPATAIFYKANVSSGTHTIAWANGTLPTDTYGEVTIVEWDGLDTSSPLDVTSFANFNSSGGGGTTAGNTGTSAASSALGGVVFVVGNAGGAGALLVHPPSTYTSIDTEPNASVHLTYGSAYKAVTGSGTQTAGWTWSGNANFQGVLAAFKNASGGGTAYELAVDPASYTLTAAAETVTATRALTISPQSYTLTASAVNLAAGRVLSVDPVSYGLTPASINLAVGRQANVDAASYAVTAAPVTATAARALSISPVSYLLTAADVTLTYAPSAKELVVDPASYTVSAANVTLSATRALTIDPAGYSLTNGAVTLSVGRVVNDAAASYTLTTSPQTLTVARALSVDPVAYALTAAPVTLEYASKNKELIVDPVSYTLGLADVEFSYSGRGGGGYEQARKVRKRVAELNRKILEKEALEEAQEIAQTAVTKASVQKSAIQGFDEDEEEALMLLL